MSLLIVEDKWNLIHGVHFPSTFTGDSIVLYVLYASTVQGPVSW